MKPPQHIRIAQYKVCLCGGAVNCRRNYFFVILWVFQDFKVWYPSYISKFSGACDFDPDEIRMIYENKLSFFIALAFCIFDWFQSHYCHYNACSTVKKCKSAVALASSFSYWTSDRFFNEGLYKSRVKLIFYNLLSPHNISIKK